MTRKKKQAIPAATPVEEIAAQVEITPDKLRLAIALAAASPCTVDLGDGLHVKVELADVDDDGDIDCHALIKLLRLQMAARQHRRIVPAAPPASKQHQSLLEARPASKRIR